MPYKKIRPHSEIWSDLENIIWNYFVELYKQLKHGQISEYSYDRELENFYNDMTRLRDYHYHGFKRGRGRRF